MKWYSSSTCLKLQYLHISVLFLLYYNDLVLLQDIVKTVCICLDNVQLYLEHICEDKTVAKRVCQIPTLKHLDEFSKFLFLS